MRRNKIASLFSLIAGVLLTAALHSQEIALVTEGKINVRGKPSFLGEVITQLERGDKVTVLERITVDKPKPNEPTNWARIKLPENTPVWIFAPFVKDGKVAATRLNLRAGPGENYSVIGRLNRGDEVNTIRTVEEWAEIQAPNDAYAFIDLDLIRFGPGTNAPAPAVSVAAVPQPEKTDTQPPPAAPAPEATAVATTPAETSATEPKPSAASSETNVPTTAVSSPETSRPPEPSTVPPVAAQTTPELPKVAQPIPARREDPLPKRVVRREGVIRPTKSIQAPTWYELANADTGKTINYLYDQKFSANSGIKLKDYRGKKVVTTGEEAIDPRWPNTPILDIETLDVVP
jgi:hypothetical protein